LHKNAMTKKPPKTITACNKLGVFFCIMNPPVLLFYYVSS
jgi:hypothetical protein